MLKRFMLTAALCLTALGAQAQNFDSIAADNPANASADTPTAVSEAAAPAAAPATAQGGGQCGDDPRLENELLSIMQSDQPVSPPITVTAETFITMDPEVLTRLAGQMVICPNNPVLKSGKPMKKVVTDFEVIWDHIRKAAIAGDEEQVKRLLTSYTAKPKTTQEIVTMLAPTNLEDKIRNSLYKTAGLEIPQKSNNALLIDFYTALGGKVSDEKLVILLQFSSIPTDLNDENNDKIILIQNTNNTYELYMKRLNALKIKTLYRS